MFLIAMARGLKGGWLDHATFAAPANRAWAALRTKIDANGVVHGIGGSTAIGDNFDHYFKRPQVDHDPRGMGAYILAAVLAADLPASGRP
jgi:rhamnogalacturonyl hydrolase YesR